MWILTPTASSRILEPFSGQLKPDWGEGVYFLSEGLATGVVVIHQLPEIPETLWLRLLVIEGTRARAIDGEIPTNLTEKVRELSVEQLENLGEALLDFGTQGDLVNWLNQ